MRRLLAMSYTERHEQFVSGLTGGPISEVYTIALAIIFNYYVWTRISARLTRQSKLLDFVFNWALPLAVVTVYAGRHALYFGLLTVLLGLNQLVNSASKGVTSGMPRSFLWSKEYLPRKPFLTMYRANLLIMTSIAILAVDFPVFPRRFAKVETWGTSLMDLGVGSQVFSMGLVSARQALKTSSPSTKNSMKNQIKNAMQKSSKLLILGLVRLILVKLLGYQEHVSEYGVHWNFFITLGLLPPLVALLQQIQIIPALITGLLISFGYELALKNTGLQEWVLGAPRVGIIAQNKEGLASFVGYLAIFMIGRSVGYYLLPSRLSTRRSILYPCIADELKSPEPKGSRRALRALVITSVCFHILFAVLKTETMPSRRLANLPYITWVVAYNTGLLAICACVCSDNCEASPSMLAVNKNGRMFFLLANLLTGLINLVLPTIDMPSFASLAVLLFYEFILYQVTCWVYFSRERPTIIRIFS